jgi:hypothetical protein
METWNEEEVKLVENPEQGPTREPVQSSEGSSATQVLETMKTSLWNCKFSRQTMRK